MGDRFEGSPAIKISLSEQRAYFYKGDHLAGLSSISSGREGCNTVTGNFHVIQKDKDHRSSLYGRYVDANGSILKTDVDVTKDPPPAGGPFGRSQNALFLADR